MAKADDEHEHSPAPGDPVHAAEKLRKSVTRLQRQLRTLRADHGVSPSKLVILGHLHRAETPLTAVELARLQRLQPQTLTRVIAELDEAGYIARRHDERDRRQVMIAITRQGRDLLARDARAQTAWLAMQIGRLTSVEQGLLDLAGPLLEKLADSG